MGSGRLLHRSERCGGTVVEVGGAGAGFAGLLHRRTLRATSWRVISVEMAQDPVETLPSGRVLGG